MLTLFLVSVALVLSGCAGSGGGSQSSTTTTSPSSPGGLTLSSTTTSLDNTVPSSVTGLISEVLSTADSKPLGSSLSIPSDSTGFSTPIFAVDKNQNLMLAAMAGSQNTSLNAKSTAEVLAILSLGITGGTSSQLTAAIDAAPSFPIFVADIQTALSQGTSPLASQNVVKDIAAVLGDALTNAYQQQSTKPFVVQPRTTSLGTASATSPLPFQILGPFSSFKTLASVYIDSLSSDGGVNLKNTLPIAFFASSKGSSGNMIDQGQTLQAFDLTSNLLLHLSTSPPATKIAGNGQKFVVTVDTSKTDQANLTQTATDIILLVINQVIDKTVSSAPGLQGCAADGAKKIVSAVSTANASIFAATATGTDVAASLAASMTTDLVSGIVKSAISCAPELAASAVYQTAVSNLTKYLVPYLGALKLAYTVYGLSGPATEFAATFYYWNQSVDVNVCEANGQLSACLSQVSLKVVWTTTPLPQSNSDAWDGTGTLTIADGQYTYAAALMYQYLHSKPDPSCLISRKETGSGGFATPKPPTPGSPWSFTVSVPITWDNFCASSGASIGGGSYNSANIVIQATPASDGSYTLSTNTTYPLGLYGGSQTTVTATGYIR